MADRIINVISNSNYESRHTTKKLIAKLKAAGLTPVKKINPKAELTITVGGDGAFIKAVNRTNFSDTPIVGINTGHLGFFQEISPDNIDAFVNAYINKQYTIEEVDLIGAEIFTKNKRYFVHAINEVLLKSQHSKTIHMNVYIDHTHLERFSGDGMLVATPSGSSGYNMSLGGSLIYPSINALILTPMAGISNEYYRSLLSSIVIPGDHIISLVPEKRYANSNLVVVDGAEKTFPQMRKINMRIADKKINKLVIKANYWDNIKSKFL